MAMAQPFRKWSRGRGLANDGVWKDSASLELEEEEDDDDEPRSTGHCAPVFVRIRLLGGIAVDTTKPWAAPLNSVVITDSENPKVPTLFIMLFVVVVRSFQR
jgi:hypothetical protein